MSFEYEFASIPLLYAIDSSIVVRAISYLTIATVDPFPNWFRR